MLKNLVDGLSVEQALPDGSYLSWIAPDGKSKKKGGTKILVRVIEYTIDTDAQAQTYRLITSLTDVEKFPALLQQNITVVGKLRVLLMNLKSIF